MLTARIAMAVALDVDRARSAATTPGPSSPGGYPGGAAAISAARNAAIRCRRTSRASRDCGRGSPLRRDGCTAILGA